MRGSTLAESGAEQSVCVEFSPVRMFLEEHCAVAARDSGEAFQIGSPDLFEGAILSADDAQCCDCKCLPNDLVQPARMG
jgi:hypothetical protein